MSEAPEEVKRLVQAIQDFEAIEDDAACAAAVSKALADWPAHHARLRELRQSRVLALKEQGKTWREIGVLLGGISPARAQQIGAGIRGERQHRPKKAAADEE